MLATANSNGIKLNKYSMHIKKIKVASTTALQLRDKGFEEGNSILNDSEIIKSNV